MDAKIKIAEIRKIQQDKSRWQECFAFICSCLDDIETQPKAIWMIGEMCFAFPELLTAPLFEQLKTLLNSTNVLLHGRAICALGRIGRSNGDVAKSTLDKLLLGLQLPESEIRMKTIWAAENIATSYPEFFSGKMQLFVPCLYDKNERVRIEAPEIFRVVGKRKPELTIPFADILQSITQNDTNRVVRIHAAGALKAMKKTNLEKESI